MARDVRRRLRFRGEVVLETALHIGAGAENGDVDLDVVRDGRGQPCVPGTSMAGLLRSLAERLVDQDAVDQDAVDQRTIGYVFGDREGAARLNVDDAPIADAVSEVRDGIGVDRRFGSAADHFLFSRWVVSANSTFPLSVTLDLGTDHRDDDAERLVRRVLGVLMEGDARLGGATSRGLGRVRLRDATEIAEDLNSFDGVLSALQRGTSPSGFVPFDPPADARLHRLHVTVTWCPDGPLFVRSGAEGVVVDGMPLVAAARDGNQLRLLLPGSSIKGALRSHAERIVRTMTGSAATGDLFQQLDAPELAVVHRLFGRASGEAPNGAQSGRVAALSIDDCLSSPIDASTWAALTTPALAEGGDGTPQERHPRGGWSGDPDAAELLRVAHHVAIDRWTGGAAEHFLYSQLEPHGLAWRPIELHLELHLLDTDTLGLAATYLLLLVLRDLADGWVPLGSGTHRGHGAVAVQRIGFAVHGAGGWLGTEDGAELSLDELVAQPERTEAARQAWIEVVSHDA